MQHVYNKNDLIIKGMSIECQVLKVLFVKIHAQVINDSHISVHKGVVCFLTLLQLCPVNVYDISSMPIIPTEMLQRLHVHTETIQCT